MEQDLQHTHRLTADLRPRHALEESLAYLVGHLFAGQLALGLTQGTDLGNGVDAGRHVIDEAPAVILDDIARCRAALVEGRASQARPADYVPGCINIGYVG